MSSRGLMAVFGVALWACAAATQGGTTQAAPPTPAPPLATEGKAPPAKEAEPAGPARLALPPGWTMCDVPMLGFRAYVPPGFMVRLRNNALFTVERPPGVAAAAAWMIPCPLKKGTDAREVAEAINDVFTQHGLQYAGAISEKSTPERATVAYTGIFSGQPCEGTFITTLAADGATGYALGVVAAKGRLAAEQPVLEYILRSFATYAPRAEWRKGFGSPGRDFTLDLPRGWKLDTTEGKLNKSDIDWMAYEPKSPSARAFSLAPKFCTQELVDKALYMTQGYRVAVFSSDKESIQASLALHFPDAKLAAATLDAAVSQAIGEYHVATNRFLKQLNGSEIRSSVYDCEAAAPGAPAPLRIFFEARIDTQVMGRGALPPSVVTDVFLKGWAAPADQFLALTPVLERITASMAYTEEYRRQALAADMWRAGNQRDTDDWLREREREGAGGGGGDGGGWDDDD